MVFGVKIDPNSMAALFGVVPSVTLVSTLPVAVVTLSAQRLVEVI